MLPQASRLRDHPHFKTSVPCAQCGQALSAPSWSEPRDERRICYAWSCDACGYEFETTVCFAARPESKAA